MIAAEYEPLEKQDEPFVAHFRDDGHAQPLIDHLSDVSRRASDAAAKIGLAPERRIAKESAQRDLDERSGIGASRLFDLSNPKLTELHFTYYFFDRKDEMTYSITARDEERRGTLLSMLSENRLAVAEFKSNGQSPDIFFRQSSMTAAKAFQPIDSDSRGVIVPYGDKGSAPVAALFAAFEIELPFRLLKRSRQLRSMFFPTSCASWKKRGP